MVPGSGPTGDSGVPGSRPRRDSRVPGTFLILALPNFACPLCQMFTSSHMFFTDVHSYVNFQLFILPTVEQTNSSQTKHVGLHFQGEQILSNVKKNSFMEAKGRAVVWVRREWHKRDWGGHSKKRTKFEGLKITFKKSQISQNNPSP